MTSSMCALLSALLFATIAIAPARVVAQEQTTAITAVRLLAASRERPGPVRPLEQTWSMYDDKDSVVVEVSVRVPPGRDTAGALLLVDVVPRVAEVRWADRAEETLDEGRMQREAFLLPAMASFVRRVSPSPAGGDLRTINVGVMHPEAIANQIGGANPRLELLDLRVRAHLVASAGNGRAQKTSIVKALRVHTVE